MLSAADKARMLLRHRLEVGAAPRHPEDLRLWLDAVARGVPKVRLDVPLGSNFSAAVWAEGLRAIGIECRQRASVVELEVPADDRALEALLELSDCPWRPARGAADVLLTALDALPHASAGCAAAPRFRFPLQLSSAQASNRGFGPDPRHLTVLLLNVVLEPQAAQVRPAGAGHVIATCVEYAVLLASLAPPRLGLGWQEAASRGIPGLRLPWSWRGRLLHLEPASSPAPVVPVAPDRRQAVSGELDALARAQGWVSAVVELAWPVYPAQDGSGRLLDGVGGQLLPPVGRGAEPAPATKKVRSTVEAEAPLPANGLFTVQVGG